jgi:hypothetical protein
MAIADLLNRSFDTTEQFANALVDVIQQVSRGTQPQPQPQIQIAPTQPTAIQQIIVDENNSEELANIVEQINSGLRAIEQARILTILS